MQVNMRHDYIYEQPRSSELLSLPIALKHKEETNATDQFTCMCMHHLKDPENGRHYMKATTLRGTIPLNKTSVWCDGKHKHQLINGRLKSGQLRTAFAQTYTTTYNKRLARDVKVFLEQGSAYPMDEAATEDPYQVGEPLSLIHI